MILSARRPILASADKGRAMIESFTRHPHQVGETYGEHMAAAAGFGWTLVGAGIACLIHAVFPFLFEKTASACVARLHGTMALRGRLPRHDETLVQI